jgi:hypothetical protein
MTEDGRARPPGQVFPIRTDDIRLLLEGLESDADERVQGYCQSRAQLRLERVVRQLNAGMTDIVALWPEATAIELYWAFDMCQESLEELCGNIASEGFRREVRSVVGRKGAVNRADLEVESEDEKEDESDKEFLGASAKVSAVPSGPLRPVDVPSEVWGAMGERGQSEPATREGCSNAYLYRHRLPGEQHRFGVWTAEEKELFTRRLAELGGTDEAFGGDWGLFSRGIPGRVGYQCSAFYRNLVKKGEIQGSRRPRKSDAGRRRFLARQPARPPRPARARRGRRRRRSEGDTDSSEDEQQLPPGQRPLEIEDIISIRFVQGLGGPLVVSDDPPPPLTERSPTGRDITAGLSIYERNALQNPMPDAVDFITGDVMRVPTISPFGHVLDYQTWLELLKTNRVYPFTRRRLTKRQLVVLTADNIEKYRSEIVPLGDGT